MRPATLVALLTAGLVAALPASAGAKAKKCKGATPYKVGKFCVKVSTFDGTGNLALIVPTRNARGKITGQGVRVGLKGPFTQTCSDGSPSTQVAFNSLGSPIAALTGAKFAGKVTSGGATTELRGRFTAANKVLVELYRRTFPNPAGATCTAEARNVSFTGK